LTVWYWLKFKDKSLEKVLILGKEIFECVWL